MLEQPGLASANLLLILAVTFALGNYWLLAARTVNGLRFNLGWSFRLGCVAALFSTVAVFDAMPFFAALAVVAPVMGATIWCLHGQRRLRRESNGA